MVHEQLSEGREAEISVDPVLQTRARLCEGKVNGPRDTFVSETLERLPLANVNEVAKLFRGRFMGRVEAPYSWKTAAYLNAEGGESEACGALFFSTCGGAGPRC